MFALRATRLLADVPSDAPKLPDSLQLEVDPFRLDPALFPKRVELELPAEAHALLLQLAARCGRSPSELAEHLISRSLQAQDQLGDEEDQSNPSLRS